MELQELNDTSRMDLEGPDDIIIAETAKQFERKISPNRWKLNSSIAFKKMDENKKKLKVRIYFRLTVVSSL